MSEIKKKKNLIIMICLLFILAVGVTFALFYSGNSLANVFEVGNYNVVTSETFTSPDNWVPGVEIPKSITATNNGDISAAFRLKFEEKWENASGTDITSSVPSDAVSITKQNVSKWFYNSDDGYYYYNYTLEPGDTAPSLIRGIVLNSSLVSNASCSMDGNTYNCTSDLNGLAGAKYTVTFIKETAMWDNYDTIWDTDYEITNEDVLNVITDSWSTIATNIRNGNGSVYELGAVKEVNLGSTFGTHYVRLVNNTTPSSCSNSSFSQTACGFVFEFTDIIVKHAMNTSRDNNNGGWRDCDMRTYVNSTIYNALPSALRNVIINTRVISPYGSPDSAPFTTTDKLYLLERKELYGYHGDYDNIQNQTRQLDYYYAANIPFYDGYGQNVPVAVKTYNGVAADYWTRHPIHDYSSGFHYVGDEGGYGGGGSTIEFGVAPVFRIG